MKKCLVLTSLVLLVGLFFIGCTTTSQSAPGVYVPLEDAEYEILGNTQAEASGFRILFFTIAGRQYGSLNYPNDPLSTLQFSALERVKGSALYKALNQMPEADRVVSPKYKIETFRIPFLFEKHTVTVIARGIKLKEGMVEK